MEKTQNDPLLTLSVSDFLAITNQILDTAYPIVAVEGEVASLRVSQGKWVFFDLKDATGSVSCFMTVWQMRLAIQDGMQVVVRATPKLTDRGRFSLTVQQVRPVGEGNLKKSFELLRQRLANDGLFAPERKRLLPSMPHHIAVISSPQAAGYADFVKIVNQRWSGLQIDVWPVTVQGVSAPDQIIQALQRCNAYMPAPQMIVIIRGGGSADDLSVFNDEALVRAIAASRIPTVVGVGHETDETLADLAADVRAATPSNAAQLIVPDVAGLRDMIHTLLQRMMQAVHREVESCQIVQQMSMRQIYQNLVRRYSMLEQQAIGLRRQLQAYDPQAMLARGYALVHGTVEPGQSITIERQHDIIIAEVHHVESK